MDIPLQARFVIIDDAYAGQRIDNFLITQLKGVPRSRIYRALRKGEVRVNKGRIQATYKLHQGDQVRLPPLRVAERLTHLPSDRLRELLKRSVIFENHDYIVLNKPIGLAVHGGSEVVCGLIEAFRHIRPNIKNLSLAHRLDRDTSGCLVLAKNRDALLAFQQLQKEQRIKKTYFLLTIGHWSHGKKRVFLALTKNKLHSGARIVVTAEEGKPSETVFEPIAFYGQTTLLRAQLITGRTHQIRVHTAQLGHPIVGDVKYGDRDFNHRFAQQYHTKRLFLHAEQLVFVLSGKQAVHCKAPMPEEFQYVKHDY